MITGDDILIEYVSRVVSLLRLLDDDFHDGGELSGWIHEAITRFVTHHVWQKGPLAGRKLWANMESRMNEMLDRRRRLIKYTLKKEREVTIGENDPSWTSSQDNYESGYKDLIAKKNSVVTRFSSTQLEDLLTSSTKNVAHEVVS